jgi:hypothetical protein
MEDSPMTEHAYGPTGAGTVMLDLGPGTGALVLYTPADLAGREIEISPRTPGARRTHASVRERPGNHRTRYAAVYAGLAPGDYTIWQDRDTPASSVAVTAGRVTCHDWV